MYQSKQVERTSEQRMNVSTSLNVFDTNCPADQAIPRCTAAGFTVLDLNYWDHQPRVLTMTWAEEEEWIHGIKKAADKHGVRFTQMHGPVHGPTFEQMVLGLDVDLFIAMAERALRSAAILEIPWVVFHPSERSSKGLEPYEEVLNKNVYFYSKLFPVMEETGVGIALENMIGRRADEQANRRPRFCAQTEHLVELIDTLNHPLVGACWDTGHGHMSDQNQADAIHMLGFRLKALHVQDNDGLRDEHLLPYQGTIDWAEVIQALHDVQYAGDFTYEAHRSLQVLPDELLDDGLKYANAVGDYLVHLK